MVEAGINEPGAKITGFSVKVLEKTPVEGKAAFTASAELTEPRYAGVPMIDYLTAQGADPDVVRQINQILSLPNAREILSRAGQEDRMAEKFNRTLIKPSAAAGLSYAYVGQLTARRVKNWQFELDGAPQAQNLPAGSRLDQFGGNPLRTDLPESAAELKSLVAFSTPATLNQLQTAVTGLKQEKLAKYLDQLQSGALFKGAATKPNGDVQILYLEIRSLDTAQQTVTADLRNDGGWDDFRRLQGTYAFDEDNTSFTLKLNTQSGQSVANAGPFLDWRENYEITFAFDGAALTADPPTWGNHYVFKLNRVPPDQKDQVVGNANATQQQWLAATTEGTNYQVAATLTGQTWARNYYLNFTKQDRAGASVAITARLFSPEGWVQSFDGLLVLNTYRAQGRPLRLRAVDYVEAARQQDSLSPFAQNGFNWYPQLDQGALTCDSHEGQSWHLVFTPAAENPLLAAGNGGATPPPVEESTTSSSPEQPWIAWTLPAESSAVTSLYGAAAQQSPAGVIVSGTTFEGFMATTHGREVTRVRLHIDNADGPVQGPTDVLCTLESSDNPAEKRVLKGVRTDGSTLDLKTDDDLNTNPGSLLGGFLKFNATVNGRPILTQRPGSVFKSGAVKFNFIQNQYGLVGSAKDNGWILLLHSSAPTLK